MIFAFLKAEFYQVFQDKIQDGFIAVNVTLPIHF